MLGNCRFTAEDDCTMVFFGGEEGPPRAGKAFNLEKSTAKTLIGFNPMNPRVFTVRLKAVDSLQTSDAGDHHSSEHQMGRTIEPTV